MEDEWAESFDDIADIPKQKGGYSSDPNASSQLGLSDFELFRVNECRILKKWNSFALDLVNEESGEEAILYFNNLKVSKAKSGCVSVQKNSKFAKLYRLTFGNSSPNFSKAHQLVKHFIGYEFFCRTERAFHKSGNFYRKVIDIKPVKPIFNSKEYSNTGLLFGKKREKFNIGKKQETTGKQTGKIVEANWKTLGVCKYHKFNVLRAVSSTTNFLMPNGVLSIDGGMEWESSCLIHKQRIRETDEEYLDRVINQTF